MTTTVGGGPLGDLLRRLDEFMRTHRRRDPGEGLADVVSIAVAHERRGGIPHVVYPTESTTTATTAQGGAPLRLVLPGRADVSGQVGGGSVVEDQVQEEPHHDGACGDGAEHAEDA